MRFRDFNQLKYLLRSIEENTSQWARRIFLVTNKQIPQYLNVNHSRIRMINHEQVSLGSNSHGFAIFIRQNLQISMFIDGNKSIIDLDNAMFNITTKPKTIYEYRIQNTIKMGTKKRSLDLLRNETNFKISFHGPILLYREIGIKIWNGFPKEMNLLLCHPFRTSANPSIQIRYIYIGYSDYYTFVKDRGILHFEMLYGSNQNKLEDKLQL